MAFRNTPTLGDYTVDTRADLPLLSDRRLLSPQAPPESLSLFVTEAELLMWQSRAVNGPYRVDGDVSANSPGDWTRVVNDKDNFMGNPTSSLYEGSVENGVGLGKCVDSSHDTGRVPTHLGAGGRTERLVAAALYALVQEDLSVAQQVRDIVVAQIDYSDTKFNDRNRWCTSNADAISNSTAGMHYGDWLAAHIYTYDMLVAYENAYSVTLITDTQKASYRTWVGGFSPWFHAHVDVWLDPLFVDRLNDDYTITADGNSIPDHSFKVYDNGPRPKKVSIRYHNRNANGIKAAGLAALIAGDTGEMARAKRWVKEVIQFATAADPWVSDFEREGDGANHGQGWSYATRVMAPAATIAEAFRAAGDAELVDYTTTNGSDQTQGSYYGGEPKSIRTGVDLFLRYVSRLEDRTYDGVDLRPGSVWHHDGMMILARRNPAWAGDTHWSRVWNRNYPGGENFLSNPRQGWFNPNTFDSGMGPAARFQYVPDP